MSSRYSSQYQWWKILLLLTQLLNFTCGAASEAYAGNSRSQWMGIVAGAGDVHIPDSIVLPMLPYRRLRGGSSPSPFLLLRLNDVNVPSTRESQEVYASIMIAAIASAMGLDQSKVAPVALVYSSRHAIGSLVLIFAVADNVCHDQNKTCSQTWFDSRSIVSGILTQQVDTTFPHKVNAALCQQWGLSGKGCDDDAPNGSPSNTTKQKAAKSTLPVWFFFGVVPGIATCMVLLCATVNVSRICKICRTRKRRMSVPKLNKLRHECVNLRQFEEDAACPICLCAPAEDVDKDLLIPPCKHFMHMDCAQSWFAKQLQCPVCRSSFATRECVIWKITKDDLQPEGASSALCTHEACSGNAQSVVSRLVTEKAVLPPIDEEDCDEVASAHTPPINEEDCDEIASETEVLEEIASEFNGSAEKANDLVKREGLESVTHGCKEDHIAKGDEVAGMHEGQDENEKEEDYSPEDLHVAIQVFEERESAH